MLHLFHFKRAIFVTTRDFCGAKWDFDGVSLTGWVSTDQYVEPSNHVV